MTHTTSPTRQPSEFTRRILLAVSGLSPQIVTETLYALVADAQTPFVPTEIHLITTLEGANRAKLALLSDDPGWFHRLCADYDLPPIAFTHDHIHVMQDDRGVLMQDIRSPQDNSACADFITAQVRALSADPDAAMHVSIAGGRKTMGFYLGYALSLYGRPQDRLSHVLVSEPFENSFGFFYPTPYSHVLEIRDKQLVDTKTATVTLAEIPFVSLRHSLDGLLTGKASFSETVAAAQAALAPPRLEINLRGRYIVAGSKRIALPPAELALLAVFARRAREGANPLEAPIKDEPDEQWGQMFMLEYRQITNSSGVGDTKKSTLLKGMDGNYFSERKSKLARCLTKALGPAASAYLINGGGTRPGRYSLALSPEAISFVSGPSVTQHSP